MAFEQHTMNNELKVYLLVDPNREGLIVDVERMTFEEACFRNTKIRAEGLDGYFDYRWVIDKKEMEDPD
jgi:hypothetical protein